MKKHIVFTSVLFFAIYHAAIAQKPIVIPLDTSLYRDLNKDGIKQKNEAVGAKIEIANVGYDKESSYGKETYFIEFKLTNIGQIDIQRASITLQWIKADENTVLETQDKYFIGYGDLPLESGFDKKIKIYYPTYKEGFNLPSIRVSAFLNIDGYKHKLFPAFTMNKSSYYVPINKKCKFEYTKIGYGTDATWSGDQLLVGRIDYKITNISKNDLDRINLVFVWKNSQTGEIFDENEEYISEKISPNKVIVDYKTSGKGYTNSTSFPFKMTLDVFYEIDEERIPIFSNLKIN
jgi:hypothetical protein